MRVQYRVVLTLILVFLVGLPLAGCSSERKEVLAYLEAAQPILNEWSDTFNRATSTARVSLSPVIGDLQRVKRDYEALEPPEPCLQAHVQVIDSMDYSIDGFLAFLADEPESVISTSFQKGDEALSRALDLFQEIRAEYGD